MKIGREEVNTIIVIGFVIMISFLLTYAIAMKSINESNQVIIFHSKPYIEKIDPSEYLVTMRVIVFSPDESSIYVIPFLALANSSGYPTLTLQGGYINQVLNPNVVGYVNVTGQNVTIKVLHSMPVYDRKDLYSEPLTYLNAFAYSVAIGEPINVTFVTNRSYVPVVWIAEPPPLCYTDKIYALYIPIMVVIPINGTPYNTTT